MSVPLTAPTLSHCVRFKIVGSDGSACSGDVTYETEIRILTEDGTNMYGEKNNNNLEMRHHAAEM